jgi:GNAT superfamily N-acetyltransferase
MTTAQVVSIDPVRTGGDRSAFLRLPHRLYSADPHWVPPLNRDIRAFLDPRRHPFYEMGDIEFFLARRGDAVVGRIAAIDNRAHNTQHGERTGFFGFFETEDDPAVSSALLSTAAAWTRERGLQTLRGPASPSLNYECGLLVDGDPGPPYLMMPHNPPWYARHLEAQGFQKAMDLLAFYLERHVIDVPRWQRMSQRILDRHHLRLRSLDLGRFRDEIRLVMDLFNDAWTNNWGFVPLGPRELESLGKELRPILRPALCTFIMKDDREVGFWLGLPDYNKVLLHLRGRLFPFGIFRLLRAKNRLTTMRVLLMGVRREFQNLGLDAALYGDILRASYEENIPAAESSWILETNRPMINALERVGGRCWRRYRLYERANTPDTPI